MLVKEALENEAVPISLVRDQLLEIRKERGKQGVGYAQRRALDHVEKFSKLSGEEAGELMEKLSDLGKVSPEIAVKMVDLLPETPDEVRAIYAKERFAIDQEKVEEILAVIGEYR
ncbi:MAG: hypothetical protein MAG715_01195 [Methanonatronarchaeales archaeon]|nr:hypothetical protein [Methanonatronarchaeales archaeon]